MKRLGVLIVLLFVSVFHGFAEAEELAFAPASTQQGLVTGFVTDLMAFSECCEGDQLGNTAGSGFCLVHCLTLVADTNYIGIPVKPVTAGIAAIARASLEPATLLRPPIA